MAAIAENGFDGAVAVAVAAVAVAVGCVAAAVGKNEENKVPAVPGAFAAS